MASKTQVNTIGVEEARREIAGGDAVAVDVRSEEEWSEGHVPGATHLPDGDADASADRPQDGVRLMVIAKDGKHATKAASRFIDEGYDAVAVDGDMDDWIRGLPDSANTRSRRGHGARAELSGLSGPSGPSG